MNPSEVKTNTRSTHKCENTVIQVKSSVPRKRQDLLKWYGWGYKDSMLKLDGEYGYFTGNRYAIGGKVMPRLIQWVQENFCLDPNRRDPMIPELPTEFPESRLPEEARRELESIAVVSAEGMDRLVRAHGQTLKDMDSVRRNAFTRIPDAVIWPENSEQVEAIVECACRRQLVLVPFGGGTCVSGAVTCPAAERRPILALDTTAMNSILWLDPDQLLARIQAGIVGQDLERELRARGFTVGHEPDSYEFSTLGGWVATRASGMKKNTYGNIEDVVVQLKVVTPRGVYEKGCRVPRMSCGPEWEHVIMGSEGSFGVITEVTLKIRPLPAVTRYGSLVFPDWEAGFSFEREVARRRLQPSSIRLIDNEQFQFGLALRPEAWWGNNLVHELKLFYIKRIKGFDLHKLCVVTLLLEGNGEEVSVREKALNAIAASHGGVPAGATNGENGYMLTFVIAYIRDMAMNYGVVAESFETSVPWDKTLSLCKNVKQRVRDKCAEHSIKHFYLSCRLTQTYDAGCCLYFYFAFNAQNMKDALEIYAEIEDSARDEIIANGGSISHHHGVGKLRKKWYNDTFSEPGRQLLIAAKQALDPNNIFALGNLAFEEGENIQLIRNTVTASKSKL